MVDCYIMTQHTYSYCWYDFTWQINEMVYQMLFGASKMGLILMVVDVRLNCKWFKAFVHRSYFSLYLLARVRLCVNVYNTRMLCMGSCCCFFFSFMMGWRGVYGFSCFDILENLFLLKVFGYCWERRGFRLESYLIHCGPL